MSQPRQLAAIMSARRTFVRRHMLWATAAGKGGFTDIEKESIYFDLNVRS